MGISPGSSAARLPYLSGIGGQGGMETIQQPTTTNASPVSTPYGMIAPNARTAALHNNLATLAETIAQATSLIQAAGLGQGFYSSLTNEKKENSFFSSSIRFALYSRNSFSLSCTSAH